MLNKIFHKWEELPISLSLKFFFAIFIVILIFLSGLSFLIYFFLKERITNSYYEKMNFLFAQLEATGKYVQKDLRPLMLKILQKGNIMDVLPNEEIFFKALSTTIVKKNIATYFNEEFPSLRYERVSFYPLNPKNQIQSYHRYILSKISKNKSSKSWRGLIKWEGEEYFVMVRTIYTEKSCLLCHGKKEFMPKILLSVYKPSLDFPWKEGDLMGIELIAYPAKEALGELKNSVISFFIISLVTFALLLISLEGIFYTLIVKPLKGLQTHFYKIKTGKIPLDNPIFTKRQDEIGELLNSFNELCFHLNSSQKKIKEHLKTLETLFESIARPIALFNKDCQPELYNLAFKNLPLKICYEEYLQKVYKTKNVHQESITTSDGKYFLLYLYPVFDEKGEVIRVVHLLEDITEQKKMEEQLILTEKLAAIGHLAAGVAHEINNPLSGILLMIKNLQKYDLSEEEKKQHLNHIETGLIRIQRIIKDLLNFSRFTEIKWEKVSINELISEVLDLSSYLIKKENIRVIQDFAPNLPEIYADKEKMEQVFLNLILNAIQAMETSSVKILTLKTYFKDNKIHISFQDTGPGIPEALATKIFDPFFTTKPPGKGTGLGLTVSLAIVKNHGGTILLEKHLDGANFIVVLPVESSYKEEFPA